MMFLFKFYCVITFPVNSPAQSVFKWTEKAHGHVTFDGALANARWWVDSLAIAKIEGTVSILRCIDLVTLTTFKPMISRGNNG